MSYLYKLFNGDLWELVDLTDGSGGDGGCKVVAADVQRVVQTLRGAVLLVQETVDIWKVWKISMEH